MKALAFMYHDVTPRGREDDSGFPGGDAARYKLQPQQLDDHVGAIRGTGRAVVAIESADLDRDPPPLVLTFDDGGTSAMTIAERLDRLGWCGHFFMTGAYVDRPGFLSRGELRELRQRGHAIGSHSYSHPLRMAALPAPRLRDEWTRSVAVLSDILGEPVLTASVPGGDYSLLVAATAADAGIRFLFTSAPTVRAERVGNLIVVGRYVVRRSTAARRVAAVAAGATGPRVQQMALWELKRVAKAVGGNGYLAIRERILGRSDAVRWGDEAQSKYPS